MEERALSSFPVRAGLYVSRGYSWPLARTTSLAAATSSARPRAQAEPEHGAWLTSKYLYESHAAARYAGSPILDDHGDPGFADESDVDAMALVSVASADYDGAAENPELIEASEGLFELSLDLDNTPEHLEGLITEESSRRAASLSGPSDTSDRIVDELNVEAMMANRVAMPG